MRKRPSAPYTPRALVIEPDPRRSRELQNAIRQLGVECLVVSTATEGWKAFARHRPTHVFAALCPEKVASGDFFLRKLNSDYVGTMPKVYLTTADVAQIHDTHPEPSAYILWPLSNDVLSDLIRGRYDADDPPGQQMARLRDLYELTLLGPDLLRELDTLVLRMTLSFQASNGIIWGPDNAQSWRRSAQPLTYEEWPDLRRKCEAATKVGTTLLVSGGTCDDTIHLGIGKSLLAAPLGPRGEDAIAGICLISEESTRFSTEACASLVILAHRLTTELAWVSAHNRLVSEHKQLRQTALLDPMLSVWTRSAFQQEVAKAISSENAAQQSFTIALFDFRHLRSVNDHHGHSVGDAVLTHFAKELNSQLRPSDQLGRFGGDELIALLVGFTLEETKRLAQQILEHLSNTPFERDDISIKLDVYCGVTQINDNETTSEGAFVRAHMALDQASRTRTSVVAIETAPDFNRVDLEQHELLPSGTTLGGMYKILHEISRGAMGIVYRGVDLGLGRPVAIKLLRSDLSSDRELVVKFRSEAALLASIRHPNLVQVFSFGTEGDAVYFVMELVEGEPISLISRRLARDGEYIDLEAVATIVEEIAEALNAIHALGIVHRDVKPENVLIDRINDRAVLVDVGIAKRVGDERDAAGTPGYAAPESFMAADEGPSTDVYGLAATTYALLTGHAPYKDDELHNLVKRQLTEPITPPSDLRGGISVAVDKVLAKALAPEPEQRYQSANALAVALTRALARPAEGKPAFPPPSLPKSFTKTPTLPNIPISTYQVPQTAKPFLPDGTANEQTERQTRGAVFRVASKVLARRLGDDWIMAIRHADPVVGELLKPTLPAQAWCSTAHLLWLLQCVSSNSESPTSVARLLGATLASSTLARFYGAVLETQTPASLLKAAESYWSRYHTWGTITVHATSPEESSVVLENAPNSVLLSEMIAGMLGHIPILAGAQNSNCDILSCVTNGDSTCSFNVGWTL